MKGNIAFCNDVFNEFDEFARENDSSFDLSTRYGTRLFDRSVKYSHVYVLDTHVFMRSTQFVIIKKIQLNLNASHTYKSKKSIPNTLMAIHSCLDMNELVYMY